MDKTCNDCKYYIRHYGLIDGRIFRIYCGHCTYHKLKTKKPDKKACENFKKGITNEKNFVNEEYLSKKLLDRVLSIKLLPKIEDLQEK